MKSKLAKARDKWFLSEDGKECCHGTATGQYLSNRLKRAFLAGADFQAEQIAELEEQLNDIIQCRKCSAKTKLSQELIGCRAKKRIEELEAKLEHSEKRIELIRFNRNDIFDENKELQAKCGHQAISINELKEENSQLKQAQKG